MSIRLYAPNPIHNKREPKNKTPWYKYNQYSVVSFPQNWEYPNSAKPLYSGSKIGDAGFSSLLVNIIISDMQSISIQIRPSWTNSNIHIICGCTTVGQLFIHFSGKLNTLQVLSLKPMLSVMPIWAYRWKLKRYKRFALYEYLYFPKQVSKPFKAFALKRIEVVFTSLPLLKSYNESLPHQHIQSYIMSYSNFHDATFKSFKMEDLTSTHQLPTGNHHPT